MYSLSQILNPSALLYPLVDTCPIKIYDLVANENNYYTRIGNNYIERPIFDKSGYIFFIGMTQKLYPQERLFVKKGLFSIMYKKSLKTGSILVHLLSLTNVLIAKQ